MNKASLNTRRFARTTGEAFKDADYGTAFWPPEAESASLIDIVRYAMALAMAIAAFVVSASCAGPSDAEAARDVAAQVSDARIDEWAQAALRANPDLSPEQLARVRTAARLIEQGEVRP